MPCKCNDCEKDDVMKVTIKQVNSSLEEHTDIYAVEITEPIRNAINLLENNCDCIPCTDDGETVICRTTEIYYMESVDKHTYVYTKEGCYETKYRLYELEEILGMNYFRCSKAMIVNIRKIRMVKADLNGRMLAELLNGERILISRNYVKDLKRKLGL